MMFRSSNRPRWASVSSGLALVAVSLNASSAFAEGGVAAQLSVAIAQADMRSMHDTPALDWFGFNVTANELLRAASTEDDQGEQVGDRGICIDASGARVPCP